MNALVAREIFGALFLTWRDQFVTVYDWLTPPGAIVLVFFFYKIDTNIERSYFLIFAINIHLIHQVYTNTKQPDRETDLSWPWYMLKASPQSYKVSSMTSFFFLLLWVPKRVATCGSVCVYVRKFSIHCNRNLFCRWIGTQAAHRGECRLPTGFWRCFQCCYSVCWPADWPQQHHQKKKILLQHLHHRSPISGPFTLAVVIKWQMPLQLVMDSLILER